MLKSLVVLTNIVVLIPAKMTWVSELMVAHRTTNCNTVVVLTILYSPRATGLVRFWDPVSDTA